MKMNRKVFTLVNGTRITNVHPSSACAGEKCVIHNPSGHHMSTWPLLWRSDRSPGIFERICEHSIGHPDPDQSDFWTKTGQRWQAVHGCDGCCHED